MRLTRILTGLSIVALTFGVFNISADASEAGVSGNSVSGNTVSVVSNQIWDYAEPGQDRTGKPVILDMDFCSDVDDAVALRVAANMHNLGIIDLKAVSLCTSDANDTNLRAANGMLNYSGLGLIPIGRNHQDIPDTSPYWSNMAKHATLDMRSMDAVKLWRTVIANSPRKVDIITTGYLTNLQSFMQSPADEISPKTGMELFNENVGNVYITGGVYKSGLDNNFWFTYQAKNSLNWILNNTQKSLIFITTDVGGPLNAGHALQKQDKEQKDPLTRALWDWGTNSGRVAWDPAAVYVGSMINNEQDLETYKFGISKIDMEFDVETGRNNIIDNPNGKHYIVYRTSNDLEYYNEILESLTIVSR